MNTDTDKPCPWGWRPFEPSREAVAAVDDETRCAVCAWPLAESVKEGCVRGSCSLRPPPATLYAPERAQRELDEMLSGGRR